MGYNTHAFIKEFFMDANNVRDHFILHVSYFYKNSTTNACFYIWLQYLRDSRLLHTVPDQTDDDELMLRYADKMGAVIVTCDTFREKKYRKYESRKRVVPLKFVRDPNFNMHANATRIEERFNFGLHLQLEAKSLCT